MKNNIYNSDDIFFTSDTHWYHSNIINFCARPFIDSKTMNIELVENWNKVVPEDATVFHLGDFAFTGNIGYIKKLTEKLNGNIVLIMGNHDHQNKFYRDSVKELFTLVKDYLYIHVNDNEIEGGQNIFLCHYPMLSWNGSVRGSWQLFGHIHSGPNSIASERNIVTTPAQYDVGVDNNNFTPISYNEVKTIITRQYLKIK